MRDQRHAQYLACQVLEPLRRRLDASFTPPALARDRSGMDLRLYHHTRRLVPVRRGFMLHPR